MEMATTYTKTVSVLGAEVLALKGLVMVCYALAQKFDDDPVARRELLARVKVLEIVTNQLER